MTHCDGMGRGGAGTHWSQVYSANHDILGSPGDLPAGMVRPA